MATKQLPSAKFNAFTVEEIEGFLKKSANSVSSEKITQGIALHVLDSKRPDNSGTLQKYVRARVGVEIAPHAFSVAVAFGALMGEGAGHVEEAKFIEVPLNWHLHASAIVNLVAKPEANLGDEGIAAVHEEIAEVYRNLPEKGEDILKLIKARFKVAKTKTGAAAGSDENKGETGAAESISVNALDALSDDYIKRIGMAALESGDKEKLTRVAQLLQYVQEKCVMAKLTELGVSEVAPIAIPADQTVAEPAVEVAAAA